MIPCAVFLRDHLESTRSIVLLGGGSGSVDGLGIVL